MTPAREPPLLDHFTRSGLRALHLGGRSVLPSVQGGMGVGVSAHRLAGSVASHGAVGTISSVDLRRHHPDLMDRSSAMPPGPQLKNVINAANVEALRREIASARQLAGGSGLLAVNVMRAVSDYASSVQTALECGIDAVVVGAGLPLDDGVWQSLLAFPLFHQQRHPACIGKVGHEQRSRVVARQIGQVSVAGLPARAVLTPWLRSYLKAEPRLQATAHKKPRCVMSFDCLAQCGLRDGMAGWGQFCIDKQLAAALRGDVAKGLFFRGAGALPFGSAISTVERLLRRLLSPGVAVGTPPAATVPATLAAAA